MPIVCEAAAKKTSGTPEFTNNPPWALPHGMCVLSAHRTDGANVCHRQSSRPRTVVMLPLCCCGRAQRTKTASVRTSTADLRFCRRAPRRTCFPHPVQPEHFHLRTILFRILRDRSSHRKPKERSDNHFQSWSPTKIIVSTLG